MKNYFTILYQKIIRIESIVIISLSCIIFFSCKTYEIKLDNPIDVIADSIAGVFPPALTMHPLTQIVSNGDSVTIGTYIIDHDTTLAGVHTHIAYNAELIQLDTILPGVLLTNSGANTPLFTYSVVFGEIDIFAWYLGEEGALSYVTETGHIAELYFTALNSGETLVEYDTTQCELVTPLDETISIRGIRNATVTIQ
ncbi:MAG: cohesin domain-containing protein [Candidatus Neomarinimicrobiota bacterium]|nr:cohesin domain-containing protein [Candidatus Neomarinimicrobiota bacterium]